MHLPPLLDALRWLKGNFSFLWHNSRNVDDILQFFKGKLHVSGLRALFLCLQHQVTILSDAILLLCAEAHQGRGLGCEALGYVQCLAQSWGCTQLGIAVISSNRKAMRFWQRAGFKETRRGNNPHFVADAVVMQAKLPLSSAL